MPIYAYKCDACGYARDVLQKISDAQLTVCPECGAAAFRKQLTAAGFQLKGSGWYATDFKGGGAPAPADSDKPSDAVKPADSADAGGKAGDKPDAGKKASESGDGKAAPAPAPAAAPAATPAAAPRPAADG